MKFESWLRKHKHRNDPIGDLARDFISSKKRTIHESFERFSPCTDAIIAYNAACEEYLVFMEKELDIFGFYENKIGGLE